MRTQSADYQRMQDIVASIKEKLEELTFLAGLDSRVLSCSEAAKYLGVDPHTISRMLKDGRLHKVSNGVRTGIDMREINTLK